MNLRMSFIFLLLSWSLTPKIALAEILKVSDGKKYSEVQITEFNKLHLTTSCIKGKEAKCAAFTATKEKVASAGTNTPYIGHPASRYCKSKEGVSRILLSNENKQYDYCLFKDGSMIDSWDLYYLHNPK